MAALVTLGSCAKEDDQVKIDGDNPWLGPFRSVTTPPPCPLMRRILQGRENMSRSVSVSLRSILGY
jgi:hypothetical protein